jgi:hypothetical protein
MADGTIDRMPGNFGQSGYLLNDQITHDHVPRDDLGPNPREYGQAASQINHAPIDMQHRVSLREDGQAAYQAQGGMGLGISSTPQSLSVDRGQRIDRVSAAGSAVGYHRATNDQFGRSTRQEQRAARDVQVSDLRPMDLQREIHQQRSANPMMISLTQEQQSIMQGFR